MQISKENKSHQLSVWLLQIDRVKISGRNLDKLNECSLAGGSGKQEKKLFNLPVWSYESLVSVKENIDRKRKKTRKKERKKCGQNTNQTEHSSRYL